MGNSRKMHLSHSKKHFGVCHVCGEQRNLSFEHIPPKSAGNTSRAKIYSGVDLIKETGSFQMGNNSDMHYEQTQQGSGVYSICAKCNSYFGSNYDIAYANAHNAAASIYIAEPPPDGVNASVFETDKMNVLAFFKRVIAFFCATTQEGLMRDCKGFLLDRESNDFPTCYRLYMFAVPTPEAKYVSTGWTCLCYETHVDTVAYLRFFPFGFALQRIDDLTNIHLLQGCDITDCAKIKWGEYPHTRLQLPYDKGDMFFPNFEDPHSGDHDFTKG